MRGSSRGGGLLLNIGTGREVSVNELARVMAEEAGVRTAPLYAAGAPRRAPTSRARPRTRLAAPRVAAVDDPRKRDRGRARVRAPPPDLSTAVPGVCVGGPGGLGRQRRSDAVSGTGLRRGGGRSRRGPRPRAANRVDATHDGDGEPDALPMTSSAAAAISSATHTSVATSSRPSASVLPRRSTTAATPARADGHVDHALVARSARRCPTR